MTETIALLVAEIKKDQRYIDFMNASAKLEEIQDELDHYHRIVEEYNELKKYESYIDLTEKKEELKKEKQDLAQKKQIQDYYQSYYALNDLLHHVTQIVYHDISDALNLTGFEL